MEQLTDDVMADIKKDVLTKLRHYLCGKIRARCHLDYLRSRRILTRDDAEEINCKTTQTKRTGLLLDILSENPQGLDTLLDSIRELRAQNFIIAKITDEVQKAKNEKMALLKAGASTSSPGSTVTCMTPQPSGMFSIHSTLLLHPDGEGSLPVSDGFAEGGGDSQSSMAAVSSSTFSCLPKPGEPGAPPLPEEEMVEDGGSPGSSTCSNMADPNFQPLRSRSLTQSNS
ncbi:B-cell lymphoma/leukemia 10 [Nerophis lumbriciformis]|uniref:B-cell lymphoma/leukemia 10 n=1 Tax=Nerophis lumbriciformis TaxID=546530 RepID=UPI002ADF7662|nr:B-cell lymphoma/leukemia 10-like [Nerophis lumbriciformis]XP_061798326.1 B-cell lymphoma/leukemia 10-like [Nerophis lumbriciformis]